MKKNSLPLITLLIGLLLLSLSSCNVLDNLFKVNDELYEYLPPKISGGTVTTIGEKVTLKVASPKEGMTYYWELGQGGGSISAEKGSSIEYRAAGIEESVKISCYGILDERRRTAKNEYTIDILDLSADCSLWLKADSIIGASDGDLVGEWQDQSNSNNHVSEEFDSCQPYYRSKGINGRPALYFTGMRALYKSSPADMGDRAEASFFAVFATGSTVADSRYVISTNNNDTFPCLNQFDSGGSNIIFNNYTKGGEVRASTRVTPNTNYLYSVLFDKTNPDESKLQIQVNGTAIGTTPLLSGADSTGNVSEIVIGNYRRYAENQSLEGYIGEIIILNKLISNKRRDKIERYLTEKWGL